MRPGSVTIAVLLISRLRRAQVGVLAIFVPLTCTLPCPCWPAVASPLQVAKTHCHRRYHLRCVWNACPPCTLARPRHLVNQPRTPLDLIRLKISVMHAELPTLLFVNANCSNVAGGAARYTSLLTLTLRLMTRMATGFGSAVFALHHHSVHYQLLRQVLRQWWLRTWQWGPLTCPNLLT